MWNKYYRNTEEGEIIMMGLHFADIFFRLLPEVYLMIYFIFMLSNKKLSLIRFLISGIIIALLVYIVRLLPIYFGIHMVINLILYISIVNINGISLAKSICNSLIAMITLSSCEIINFLLLNIFNINYYENEYVSFNKNLYKE